MGAGVCRIDDTNNAKKKIGKVKTTPQTTVFVNGLLAAVHMATISTHKDGSNKHKTSTIREVDITVMIEGSGVAFVGSKHNCNHKMKIGSEDVFCSGVGTSVAKDGSIGSGGTTMMTFPTTELYDPPLGSIVDGGIVVPVTRSVRLETYLDEMYSHDITLTIVEFTGNRARNAGKEEGLYIYVGDRELEFYI